MFIDTAKIKLKAGDGGNGCRSFYRDRHKRHPSRDGGDGGKGADIRFHADSKIHTLLDFRFRQHFNAKSGGHGSSQGKRGKGAPDLIIKVPCGTVIRDVETGLLLRDLSQSGEELIAVKGGRGGRGNITTRADAEKGVCGEQREVS